MFYYSKEYILFYTGMCASAKRNFVCSLLALSDGNNFSLLME